MPARTVLSGFAVFAVVAIASAAAPVARAESPQRTAHEQRFHAVYKELIEINTSHSAGDNTAAARAMRQHLLDAGFAAADMEIFEPFPKKGNLVLRYKGDGSRKPLLLLGHLDVVEARREDWKTDPFKLQESDGYFTARGAIDDKVTIAAMVSALMQLKQEGLRPRRDIVLALTADEERGDVPSNGVYWLVNNKPELLQAEFGINEGGGGELRDGKPSVHRIQLAEKVYVTYELEVRDPGGHSSLPKKVNPIYTLAAALGRLDAHRFPVRLAEVTTTQFARNAALVAGQLADDMRAAGTGNPDPAVIERLSANPQYNAQLRTTCVATMVTAGHAENALPQSAKATVNCRILPHDDPDEIDRQFRKVIGDPAIEISTTNKPLRSPASPLSGELMAAVEKINNQMWPGVPVVPAMSAGATDSRFLRNFGIPTYGVTGKFLDPADARSHGLDERIGIDSAYQSREFMYRLIKELAQ